MSKRFQPPKEFMRQAKIPKLDININRRSSNLPHQAAEGDDVLNNLWDDSDDDVLLLATQVAEKQQTSRLDTPQNDITFSEFVPGAHAQTSTQRYGIASPAQLLEDADDDAFNNLVLPSSSTAIPKTTAPAAQVQAEKERNAEYFRMQAQSVARCQLATENQLHSVNKHLADLQAENLRLKNELLASKEMMQSKTGETALLRDELRYIKQQLQQMKMEKIMSTEAAKNECETKIIELTRKIETRETQLQMKSAECASLKMRHADESRRLEESQFLTQPASSTTPPVAAPSTKSVATETLQNDELQLTSHVILDINIENISKKLHVPQCIFAATTERGEVQQERSLMTSALEQLQMCLAQLNNGILTEDQKDNMTEQLLISATRVFKEFCNYLLSLSYPKNVKYYPPLNHNHRQNKPAKIFNNYRAIDLSLNVRNRNGIVSAQEYNTMAGEWIDIKEMRKQLLTQAAKNNINADANVEYVILKPSTAPTPQTANLERDLNFKLPDHNNDAVTCEWMSSKTFLESMSKGFTSSKVLNNNRQSSRRSMLQPNELFTRENAVTLRRYIAALALSCTHLPKLATKLLNEKHQQRFLLQIISKAINKLSYSLEICEHQCLLEALTVLLQILLKQEKPLNEHVPCLAELLKQLVFSRPNAWVLREITVVCIIAIEHWPQLIDKLCVNSDATTYYIAGRTRPVCRFNNKSCVFQVYAGLLEAAFSMYTKLSAQQFKLLITICEQHVRFVYYCFIKPPEFLRKLLGFYENSPTNSPNAAEVEFDESKKSNYLPMHNGPSTSAQAIEAAFKSAKTAADNEQQQSNNSAADIKCACYVAICLSVVSLVYQMLYNWLLHEKKSHISDIANISQISVQLLHMIFCENYLTRLLIDGEVTTRHQLYMICKWWSEHATILEFNTTHMFLLEKLQNCHVMPKSLEDEVYTNKMSDDLNELNVTSNFNIDNFEGMTSRESAQAKIESRLADPKLILSVLNGYAFTF